MKKLLIILFWLVATTVYAQDPDLGGNTIVGTMTPTGPLAIGEPVYFDIITGNAGGDMNLPSPGGAPYSFTIRTTNIGIPSISLTGGTNYYSVPVITSLSNGEYSILITQILPIPEQEYTNFRVTGTTEKTLGTAGVFEAGYSTTVDVSGYAATNSPPDDPSSRREIGNLAITPPVAVANPVPTPNNTPVTIPVLTNDTPGSAAIDPTSVMLITPGTGLPVLTLTVVGEGTYTVTPATGAVTFTPLPTFSGIATPVNYTVEDVNGVVSNQAPITVTVGAPTPPIASNDTPAPNPPGLPLIIPVLSNDTPGSSAIAPASVKLIDPGTGLPVPTVTIPNVGTYAVNPDGTITFTPDPALTTTVPTTVNYTVTDVNGLTSNQATITLNATPLPVTLVSFSVKKEGTVSILNWATTMETNSDRFEIQRSLSGKEWSEIGSVDSHRESTVKQTYTFTDKNPSQGENLYRLKMIDRDATYAYSRIQSVKFDGAGTPAISIYPNPSSDKVFLQDADLAQVKQASILDMTGRAVFSSSKVDSSGINVSKLIPGTYILHVTNLNGSSSSHKFVIVR
jgi:CshA-type fibril repeat protein